MFSSGRLQKIFSPPLKPFSGEENSSAQNSPIPLRAGAHSRGVIEANSLRTKTHCSHRPSHYPHYTHLPYCSLNESVSLGM